MDGEIDQGGSEPAWGENSGSSWCYTNVLSFYRFVASFFVCIVKVQSRVAGSVARAEGGSKAVKDVLVVVHGVAPSHVSLVIEGVRIRASTFIFVVA